MQINVNTDNTIQKHQGLDEHVAAVVQSSIGRFGEQVTRVDVHLSDENKEKHADGGNYCMMEARVSGYQPIVVHEHAVELHQSIKNAGGKLARALDPTPLSVAGARRASRAPPGDCLRPTTADDALA